MSFRYSYIRFIDRTTNVRDSHGFWVRALRGHVVVCCKGRIVVMSEVVYLQKPL